MGITQDAYEAMILRAERAERREGHNQETIQQLLGALERVVKGMEADPPVSESDERRFFRNRALSIARDAIAKAKGSS